MRKKKIDFVLEDYYVVRPEISSEEISRTIAEIRSILPDFRGNRCATLMELDVFLSKKYKATKADWKDIDKCTRTKARKYNEYSRTVFSVSECHIADEEYYSSYIIKREQCIHPSKDKDDFFYDMFIMAGSNDGKHFTSSYVGGHSDGMLDEMFVLSGKHLK